jgi:hypothetical protein
MYWEANPLHIQGRNARYYDQILTVGDLENLIAAPDARYPAIQLSKNGAYFPPEVYSQDFKLGEACFSGVPDVHKIAWEYRAGATVVMPALHRTWRRLKHLCTSIEHQLAYTSETHSAHVTLGIAVYTRLDLAGELLHCGMESLRLRRALPPGFARRAESRSSLKDELIKALVDLRASADDARLIDLFLNRVRSHRAKPEGAFRADASVIGLHTVLTAPDPQEYRIAQQDGRTAIEFQSRKWLLPATARAALDAIRDWRVFRPDDLPGPLDADAKLSLVRSLHKPGFLTRCDDEAQS